MLVQTCPVEVLAKILIPREAWRPFPAASERTVWEALPERARELAVARGEQWLGAEWPPLPAVRFLDFVRNGNRSRYEALSFRRRAALADLAIAECVECRGRFVDDLVNGVWAICEESFWGIPAHVGVQKAGGGLPDTADPIVDLFAAETGALLAWCSYLFPEQLDRISALLRQRIQREVDSRILGPLLRRDDFHWMGFGGRRVNNWNPWINSNWLAANLLLEPGPERRLAATAKAMRSLDNFIDPYPRDGGCDEGPGYWSRAGASLFDCLELLRSATDGRIDVYGEPVVREIGRYICRAHVHDHYFVNFADASAVVRPPPAVVYGYGRRISDEQLTALGAWLHASVGDAANHLAGTIGRRLPALFAFAEIENAPTSQPLLRDVWFPDIQVMTARDAEGSPEGFFIAAKGGHNAESHNHNDVGSFLAYRDGRPLIVDAGVERYTRKTFSPTRYEIWTMQSAFHSLLPAIDGVMQAPGQSFAANGVSYECAEPSATLELDIAGAYPAEANLRRWTRTVCLEREREVRITDDYELTAPVAELTLSLLTPCRATQTASDAIQLDAAPLPDGRTSANACLHCGGIEMETSIEPLPITDERLQAVWGEQLTRILFRADRPPQRGGRCLRIRR